MANNTAGDLRPEFGGETLDNLIKKIKSFVRQNEGNLTKRETKELYNQLGELENLRNTFRDNGL